ncbi:hypothetical protein [Cupriavidus alkaliphilus]|uniref:hypothetical protein n=1 Tax=Cupriavidus alkaliphilus TaxID=942866 RepID=UPI000B80F437|nr:hypothetical protein [Cupriavidus alkaliphilus]
MLKRVWQWFEVGAALLALTILTLACHAMWPDKDGVAAWFQAIGSVAGIGIAVYVPWRQRRDQIQQQNFDVARQRVGVARRLYFLSTDFVRACQRYADDVFMEGNSPPGLAQLEVEDLVRVMEVTRMLEAQDHDNVAVPMLYAIRAQADLMITKVKRVARNPGESDDFFDASRKWLEHASAFQLTADGIKRNAERRAHELGIED